MFIKQNALPSHATNLQLKRLSKVWASLSNEEKQIFRDEFEKYQEKYPGKLALYRNSLTDEQLHIRSMYLMRREQLIAKRRETALLAQIAKPRMKFKNSFGLFFLDHYIDRNGKKRTDEDYISMMGHDCESTRLTGPEKLVQKARELGKKWSGLSSEEKAQYEVRSLKLKKEQLGVYTRWEETVPRDYLEALRLLNIEIRVKKRDLTRKETTRRGRMAEEEALLEKVLKPT